MVEILMATYNGEKYLQEQIDSIRNQTYKEWILTIRDDFSQDKTLEILKEYEKIDNRINILKDEKGNLGYKKNFEKLLKNSVGDIIFLCDQDDVWEKNKISECLSKIGKKAVLHHNATIVYEKKKFEEELFKNSNYRKSIKNFYKPSYTGCCMVLKKDFLKKILPIPKNYPGHDTWIGLLASLENEIKYIDDKLIKYRRHENNISFTSEKSKNSIFKKIIFRYYYIVTVISRFLKNYFYKF